jgi:polar amino acid transport system substrate-binding protein
MRLNRALTVLVVPLLIATSACAPTDDSSSSGAGSTTTPSGASSTDACATANLALKTPGQLTVATDVPAYDPWFTKNDPANGKGYESAVAYAVAKQLGFGKGQVKWVKEPFNNSYAPGPKNFDFDINQISITPARAKVVDFSDGYYSAAQAVIALKGSKAADATTLAGLKGFKLGAQTGTTSLSAIRDVIKPSSEPLVFDDTNAAKQALNNGQLDAILADLPTAFYITAVEITKGTIVGQFQPESGHQEEFGMLFEKGSKLVPCVDKAIATLKQSGELASIEKRWLSDVVDVPVLK